MVAAAEKAAKGELEIHICFSSQLGDQQTVLRQTVRGRIDISGQFNTAASLGCTRDCRVVSVIRPAGANAVKWCCYAAGAQAELVKGLGPTAEPIWDRVVAAKQACGGP